MASIDRLYAYAEERNKGQSQEQAAKTAGGKQAQNQNGTASSSQTKTSLTGQNRLYEYAKLRNKGYTSEQAKSTTTPQSSNLSGPLSSFTNSPFIKIGGVLWPTENFEVRDGNIFDVTAEKLYSEKKNAAIKNTQANYEQFLNGKLKEYGSERTGKFGQYTNNFYDGVRYAEHEQFMSSVLSNNLGKQLEKLQEEYDKLNEEYAGSGSWLLTPDDTNRMRQMEDLQTQIEDIQSQIKE